MINWLIKGLPIAEDCKLGKRLRRIYLEKSDYNRIEEGKLYKQKCLKPTRMLKETSLNNNINLCFAQDK